MSISLPNGALVSIAGGYATSKNITAISNANPGVASSAASKFVNGDFLEVTSGWSRLTDKVGCASQPRRPMRSRSARSSRSTLTSIYPTGGGACRLRSEKDQWLDPAVADPRPAPASGEQQNSSGTSSWKATRKRIPTFKSAAGLTFSVADDPTQPGYQLASASQYDRLPRAPCEDHAAVGRDHRLQRVHSLNKTPSLQ